MEALKIMAFSTIAAVCYGMLHDQVTAHVCVEYFTIAHPPVFPTESPFLLALGWGVIATWWVGLPLGVMLAAAARIGPARKWALPDLRPSIIGLMVVSGMIALASGLVGAALVAAGIASVPAGWAVAIPSEKHVAFSFDAWAHTASYLAGAFGGSFLVARTAWVRYRSTKRSAAA